MENFEEDPVVLARRLAAIVESSDDAIVSKDLNGVVTSWNEGARRIFGYTAQEMVGEPILKLIPEERRQEEDMILSKLRQGIRIEHFETVRVAKDGRRLDISLSVSPLRDAAGKVVGASKIARDITERKALEQAAENASKEREKVLERERAARLALEKAGRVKDEFLATLGHELRTPLNAILGWASVLKTGDPGPDELKDAVEAIERNARAQSQIINDLLDMSSIISGKIRLDVQSLDLADILNSAIKTIQMAANAKGVRLQVVLDPVSGRVSGDPNRLQQVFWNLLTNAVKFTPKDGRIQVLLERVNSHVEVSIHDTGEGIAPEFLPYVFNRFEQADASTTRKHGGLGIGLAIVKQLVELHGGRVRVKSPGQGQGATFSVELPIVPVHSREPSERPVADSVPAPFLGEFDLQGVRILAVDDEADSRKLVQRLLEMSGAEVVLAGSAAEAFAALTKESFDVLLCDIGMPEEDGYSLMRRIRRLDDSRRSEIAAIALTAYARLEDRTQAINAGFQNHLTKPVEAVELLTVIRSLAKPRSVSRL